MHKRVYNAYLYLCIAPIAPSAQSMYVCVQYVCAFTVYMCIYSIHVHLHIYFCVYNDTMHNMFVHCALCVHIYIINHPTNRLQQKEATIQHQQNASTMQLLQIQNGVIYANGIRKFVRKTPLERWYL